MSLMIPEWIYTIFLCPGQTSDPFDHPCDIQIVCTFMHLCKILLAGENVKLYRATTPSLPSPPLFPDHIRKN